MSDAKSPKAADEDVERALLDAELFVKYKATRRALETLQEAVVTHPRSVQLREKLREVALASKQPGEAARQCLALANLYIAREDFDAAHERLLEARQIDPRISITTGLEAIRRARRPDQPHGHHPAPAASVTPPPPPPPAPAQSPAAPRAATLAGDLSSVSIFDAVQVIENARLTGALSVEGGEERGRVLFNDGLIVGAECGGARALEAFRRVIEITAGSFDFEKHSESFPVTINAPSNTSLILDSLREMDEEKQG